MKINGIPGMSILRTVAEISHSIFANQASLRWKGVMHGLPYDCSFAKLQSPAFKSLDGIPETAIGNIIVLLNKDPRMSVDFPLDKAKKNAGRALMLFGRAPLIRAIREFGPKIITKFDNFLNIHNITMGLFDIMDSAEKNRYFSRNEIEKLFHEEILKKPSIAEVTIKGEKVGPQNFSIEVLMHLVNNIANFYDLEPETAAEDIEHNRAMMRQLKLIEDWLYYHPEVMKRLFDVF